MASQPGDDRALIRHPTSDDVARIRSLLTQFNSGQSIQWSPQSLLDTWVIEQRLEADRIAAKRVLFATWVLAIATIGLVLATIGLIVVTVD